MANFENSGVKEANRTGETNVKHSLYIPITVP